MVKDLSKLVSSSTRIKVFLKILLFGPVSTTELAKRLDLPVANVSYHVKRLESDGFVEPVSSEVRPFKEKRYSISRSFSRSLRPDRLNDLLLESEPSKIRNFVVALLLVAGESLKTIAESYAKVNPIDFSEKFFYEHGGFIGMIPISLLEQEEFVRELRALIVRHLSSLPIVTPKDKDKDALAVVGVLPFNTSAVNKGYKNT